MNDAMQTLKTKYYLVRCTLEFCVNDVAIYDTFEEAVQHCNTIQDNYDRVNIRKPRVDVLKYVMNTPIDQAHKQLYTDMGGL
jgi:hypothetical protein